MCATFKRAVEIQLITLNYNIYFKHKKIKYVNILSNKSLVTLRLFFLFCITTKIICLLIIIISNNKIFMYVEKKL